jgi:hypothetical protein
MFSVIFQSERNFFDEAIIIETIETFQNDSEPQECLNTMFPLSFEGTLRDICYAAEKESEVDRKSGCLRVIAVTLF